MNISWWGIVVLKVLIPRKSSNRLPSSQVMQILTVLSMYFYKTRLVEVRECGYTILEDFIDLIKPRFLNDV